MGLVLFIVAPITFVIVIFFYCTFIDAQNDMGIKTYLFLQKLFGKK